MISLTGLADLAPDTKGMREERHKEYLTRLRDEFAGQAMQGQLAFSPHDSFEKVHMPEDVAMLAYRFADAMLAAREGGAA